MPVGGAAAASVATPAASAAAPVEDKKGKFLKYTIIKVVYFCFISQICVDSSQLEINCIQ